MTTARIEPVSDEDVLEILKFETGFWPYFYDANTRRKYSESLATEQRRPQTKRANIMMCSVCAFISMVKLYIFMKADGLHRAPLFLLVTFLISASAPILGIIYIFMATLSRYITVVDGCVIERIMNLARMSCFSMNLLCAGLWLVARTMNGTCSQRIHESAAYQLCNPTEFQLPTEHVALIYVYTMFNSYFIRDCPFYYQYALLLSVAVCILFSVYLSCISNRSLMASALIINALLLGLVGCMYYVVCNDSLVNFEQTVTIKRFSQLEVNNAKSLADKEQEQLRMVLANVAHDLRTPLQAFDAGMDYIKNNLSNLSNIAVGNSAAIVNDLLQTLEEMRANCVFMTMQINRSLDVCKVDSNFKLRPNYESVNVSELCKWAMRTVTCYQSRVHVKIKYLDVSVNPQIVTDKVWFQENVLCLLSNAVKFSPESTTVWIRMSVASSDYSVPDSSQQPSTEAWSNTNVISSGSKKASSDTPKRVLLIEVIDCGIGVAEDKQSVLFKPFSQTQRRAGGTGLGLYSLALRLKALEGNYGMKPVNEADRGSVFWFSLPYNEDRSCNISALERFPSSQFTIEHVDTNSCDNKSNLFDKQMKINSFVTDPLSSDSEKKLTKSCRRPLPSKDGKPTVLVVDDSFPTVKLVSRALINAGIVVDTASDGYSGLNKMKSNMYTLVVMDIQMPIMDGIESTRQLRIWEDNLACTDGAHQIVLGASAAFDDETRSEAALCGMDDFIVKPFDIRQLIDRVSSCNCSV